MIHVAPPARPSQKRPPVRDYLFLATAQPDAAVRAKVRDVILHVAKIEGALFAEIVSQRRTKRIAEARQIAMWVSVTICGRTLPEIGRVIGRDHTTILHGARKIAKAVEIGAPLGKRAEKCRAAVLWNLSKTLPDIAETVEAPTDLGLRADMRRSAFLNAGGAQ